MKMKTGNHYKVLRPLYSFEDGSVHIHNPGEVLLLVATNPLQQKWTFLEEKGKKITISVILSPKYPAFEEIKS